MKNLFAAWGRVVHRRRWIVLATSAIVLAGSLAALAGGGKLRSYNTPSNTESGDVEDLIAHQIGNASQASIILVLTHPTWNASDADGDFARAAQVALATLRNDSRVASLTTPWSAGPAAGAALVSADGHHALAIVKLREDIVTARDQFPELRAEVTSSDLQIHATAAVAIYSDINHTLGEDLQRSEIISLPLSVILLLVVFGTLAAALLPVGVGGLAVVGGMGVVMLASRHIDVSVYAINIVTLIGLGVAIDYSLFVVSRFREELARGLAVENAIVATMSTAGRATFFSGLTVAIGLLGLVFYRGLYFNTMGMAGAIVVALAVLAALSFLPALLSVLGTRVNRWRVPLPRRKTQGHFWHDLAHGVMKRPVLVIVPMLTLLLVAGLPFAQIKLAGADVTMLPPEAESRIGAELLKAEFPRLGTNTILVVAQFPDGDPLASDRVGAVYDLSRTIAALPTVSHVTSIVDLDPSLSKASYQQMYGSGAARASLPPGAQQLVRSSVGSHIVLLTVDSTAHATSDAARDLVNKIRALPSVGDGRVLVGGTSAVDLDTISLVAKYTPIALAFIVITTYLLLFAQTGSVILPIKALVMNLLSISASFGALVWVFQEGHLSGLLHFTPAPLDPSIPVLLFCIVFGLSMDYEVLMLSRMHEEYERTGDNTHSVAWGLEHTGRLITSAAGIMVLVFASFATAHVTLIKAIGFGLALAIAIDATLVRALVVPAAMRLMGDWNWWSPWRPKKPKLVEFTQLDRAR